MLYFRSIQRCSTRKCARLGETKLSDEEGVINAGPKVNLIWMHDLLDQSKSFKEIASSPRLREVANSFLIDARNHGKSEHVSVHTFNAMSLDLVEYIANRNMDNIFLLGHGMGGKTILTALHQHKAFLENRVKGVVLLNTLPRGINAAGLASAQRYINQLKSIDLSEVHSKEEASIKINEKISIKSVAEKVLANLKQDKTVDPITFKWRTNLPVIEESLSSLQSSTEEQSENLWEGPRRIFITSKSARCPIDAACEDYKKIFAKFSSMKDLVFFTKSKHFLYLSEQDKFVKELAAFIEETKAKGNQDQGQKKYLDEALAFDV